MKNLFILMLLISFGSIGAVFFTPGLPEIAHYFQISNATSELTVTWYLIGYTIGQLLYGPMAHSIGSNRSIMVGALLALIGTVICIVAGMGHSFLGLVIGRAIMALGAGSGLKMTYTLSTHIYTKEEGARAITLLTMAFAIMPGIGVFIGGLLVHHFGFIGSFYLMVVYSLVILLLSYSLPEMYPIEKRYKFSFSSLFVNYTQQFKNTRIVSSGLLAGVCSSTVYAFAALAPFIAIQMMNQSPEAYGIYNLIPVVGVVSGALIANYCSKYIALKRSIKFGLIITMLGTISLFSALIFWPQRPLALFLPMIIINLGRAFIYGNATSLGLATTLDNSNGSAVVSFLNMSLSCLVVLILGCITIHSTILLPMLYVILLLLGVILYKILTRAANKQ